MQVHPVNPEILYAGGPGGLDVAKSSNQGNSWKLILGTWENLGSLQFLKVDRNNPKNLWAGGSGATFRAFLAKTNDGGATWQDLPITGAEANVNDLLVKSGNSQIVIAGLEGAFSSARIVRKSTDGGQNWTTVFEGIGTRTMTHSVRQPETIYASGQNGAGNLFFVQSNDFGDTWQQVSVAGAPEGIIVNDMVSVMVDGQEVLYFATNKGVYSYTFEK